MTCRELYGFLDEFMEGRLDVLTRLAFVGHLTACAACRKYLATYRATIETARLAERADALPAEVPEELIQAILASRAAAFARQPPE